MCLMLGLAFAQAGEVKLNPQPEPPQPEKVFNANEVGLSLFGSISDESLGSSDEDWGFGLAANYFPLQKFLGFQVGSTWRNMEGTFMDDVEADMILRFPIDRLRLAPYVIGGGAYRFEQEDWDVSVGPGLQYRFTDKWGVFGEYRYHFDREAIGEEVNEVRFGINLVF